MGRFHQQHSILKVISLLTTSSQSSHPSHPLSLKNGTPHQPPPRNQFPQPLPPNLIPAVSSAFAIQTTVAIPSILAQSERFYDLSSSLTYLSVTALSLYLPTLQARAAGTANLAWPSLLAAFTGKGGPNRLNRRQDMLSAAVSF
jgi:hypothetical protein